MNTSLLINTVSVAALILNFLASSGYAQADASLGKTGKHVRFISFRPLDIDGESHYANDALTIHSRTEFEYGGFYRPPTRIESISIVDIQNPEPGSVIGTIVVEVELSKQNNEPVELDLTKLVPNTVYRIEAHVLGPETVPMMDIQSYLVYYGPKMDLIPPVVFNVPSSFGKIQHIDAIEQLSESMTTYRMLCDRSPKECKNPNFHPGASASFTPEQHNRQHIEVYIEQYTVRMIENEKEKAASQGLDISLAHKRELLSAYEGILKKFKNYDPLTAEPNRVYLAKIAREVRLLKLDIQSSERLGR